jgi:YVTN family beta-propeller protein
VRANGIAVHPDGRHVYVSAGGDGTVQVIDTAQDAIVATIPVGKRPWNMALTPDGRKLYVACGRSNAVAVVDTQSNRKITDVPVGELPWGVVVR